MKVNCTCQPVTPPSNSEKEKEDTERDIRMLMSGFPHYLYRIKEPVSDELMIASGYIKMSNGDWISQGEATPAQMAYHMDWIKSKKEPVKKPLLAIFNGKIDVNESLRRIAKYLDENK